MTPTPKHQRCGHLASGPEGFPCPHPTCWTGGVLQVVTLPNGPEEFWERLLYVPRGAAMFFGWRLVGDVATASIPRDDPAPSAPSAPIAPPLTEVKVAPGETPAQSELRAISTSDNYSRGLPCDIHGLVLCQDVRCIPADVAKEWEREHMAARQAVASKSKKRGK